MQKRRVTWLSKTLSYLLRHGAYDENLKIDPGGWVKISDVLDFINSQAKKKVDIEDLKYLVGHNDKRRFTLRDDKIRANQGHSFPVDLGLKAKKPPDVLYHGTYQNVKEKILKQGLKKMQRNHVHLSSDVETAIKVGKRRGKPIIFQIEAKKMHEGGHTFLKSENDVWLVNYVPPNYLNLKNELKGKN